MAGLPAKDSSLTAVYRFFNAEGQLLYVGISMDLADRFRSHRHLTTWWRQCSRVEFTWYPNRREALTAETLAIEAENPMFNATSPNIHWRARKSDREIADDLAARIRSGEYPPGGPLPSYSKLADLYSVSVSTAQRAVALLHDRGLIIGEKGVGLYVAKKEA